jgi:DNA-binding response OmpR family regulator
LLVDPDPGTRQAVRRLLADRGLDLVLARTGIAGLELILRLPDSFRLVIISLDLPGLSGEAVIETLRHFRPELPLLCLTNGHGAAALAVAGACLPKPINDDQLATQLDGALAGIAGLPPLVDVSPDAIARAQARYASSGNLVEAALEVERGISGREL